MHGINQDDSSKFADTSLFTNESPLKSGFEQFSPDPVSGKAMSIFPNVKPSLHNYNQIDSEKQLLEELNRADYQKPSNNKLIQLPMQPSALTGISQSNVTESQAVLTGMKASNDYVNKDRSKVEASKREVDKNNLNIDSDFDLENY
jgi:hypothetical protein